MSKTAAARTGLGACRGATSSGLMGFFLKLNPLPLATPVSAGFLPAPRSLSLLEEDGDWSRCRFLPPPARSCTSDAMRSRFSLEDSSVCFAPEEEGFGAALGLGALGFATGTSLSLSSSLLPPSTAGRAAASSFSFFFAGLAAGAREVEACGSLTGWAR